MYWTIALALAVTAGVTVHRQSADARQLVDRLGSTTQVLISEAELAPGDPIAPLTRVAAMPVGLAPASALGELPVDAAAGRRIPAGAVLTALDLAQPTEAAAGEAAIAVASTQATPPLAPGDSAVLIVAADPFVGLEARMIDARVVSIVDERLVVAVDVDDLTDIAAAVRAGGITVAAGP